MAEVASPLARTVEARRGPARLVDYLNIMATSVVAGVVSSSLTRSRGLLEAATTRSQIASSATGISPLNRTRPSFCGVVPL
jgi:hypothetical protein